MDNVKFDKYRENIKEIWEAIGAIKTCVSIIEGKLGIEKVNMEGNVTMVNNDDDFKVEPVDIQSIEPNCGYDPATRVCTIHTTTRFDDYFQCYYETEEHYNVYGDLIAKYTEKIPVNQGCKR